jgi:cyanophycinase
MTPKGKLLIIGGAEDKGGDETPEMADYNKEFEHFEILKELLPKGKRDHKIEIITTASSIPGEIQKAYSKAFKKIGYSQIGFMHIDTKEGARSEEYAKRLEQAGAVLFSGGDQFHISTVIGGSKVGDLIMDKYTHDKDFIVAGTSAGAMALTGIMIWEGGTEEALIDKDLKTSAGLGLLKHCIVDTHFIKRGRFGRLSHAVIINPAELGIGLGEDTALLIRKGTEATCYGSGMVVIIDGKEIAQTNITDADSGCPVYVENLKVHLLVKGCKFSLSERKLYQPAMVMAKNS